MDTIIIGCGASGIVTSIFSKNKNNRVIILEKNKTPLKKLLITGNGRCNYLNEKYSINNYYSKNLDIVDKIITDKNINEVKDFFDSIGIIPKIKNGYYYPVTNQATTIKNALAKEAELRGVEIIYEVEVLDIEKEDSKFIISTNNGDYTCDNLVISTGGVAYPKTGSDGFGYNILEKLGHSIIKPTPALVGLESDKKYFKDLDGVRTDVYLELFEDGKFIKKEEGEIQFTKYGLSGICIFNLTNYISRGLEEGKEEIIKINLVPFIDTLITPWMDKYAKNNKSKNLSELLEGFLNYKLVNVILKESNLEKDKYYLDLSNEEKLSLCKKLRCFKVKIDSTKGFDHAQISNGGIPLDEIDYLSMESKKIKNLYITGEVLDINGDCGGYNLTNAWITGMIAGKSIGEKDD